MDYGFFGSAVLWLLVTFPAYWLYQWTVEGEPFGLWRAHTVSAATDLTGTVSQTFADAGVNLSAATSRLSAHEPAWEAGATH